MSTPDDDESTRRRDRPVGLDDVAEATTVQPMPTMDVLDATHVDNRAAEAVVSRMTREDAVTEERPSAARVGAAVSPSMMDTARVPQSEIAAGRALAAAHPDGVYRDDDATEYRPSPGKIATARALPASHRDTDRSIGGDRDGETVVARMTAPYSDDDVTEERPSGAKLMAGGAAKRPALAAAAPHAGNQNVAPIKHLPDFNDGAVTELIDPLIARARERIGKVLREKWRLDALIGVGGMAAVYLASHRNGGRVAIKMLHAELSNNAQVQGRFRREGRVASAVQHEGVVKVIDDDVTEDGCAFLVMELLDGETLEERRVRKGGTLSEDEVLRAADQLLDVLVAAHARGIVHRDLKPENVFLTRTGVVRVLDFGIARLRGVSTKSTATQMGSSMGTPQFMPPEQARALWDQVDGRSDLWAVGATMFTLLTGQLIHNGRTTNEVLLSAMSKAAPPVASVATSVSPAVAMVVDRALAFEREHRWLDATRMQEAIRHAYLDRFGKPITTSPKLVAPEITPDEDMTRAMPGPVAAPRVWRKPVGFHTKWLAVLRLPPSRTVIAAVACGVVLALLGVIAVVGVSVGSHDSRNADPLPVEPRTPVQSASPVVTNAPPPIIGPALTTVAPSGSSQARPTAPAPSLATAVEPSAVPNVDATSALPGNPYAPTAPPASTPPPQPAPMGLPADRHLVPSQRAAPSSARPRHAGAGSMDGE